MEPEWLPRMNRAVEPHHPDLWRVRGASVPRDWEERLRELGPALWAVYPDPQWPEATVYPKASVEYLGGIKLGCSIAYLIGLAVYEFMYGGARRLYLVGADLDKPEYAHQRENVIAWLMFAKGKGMIVTGPSVERLLNFRDYGDEV